MNYFLCSTVELFSLDGRCRAARLGNPVNSLGAALKSELGLFLKGVGHEKVS
jgi:hypothetical protein